MSSYKEIEGDLIELAKEGTFDVIAHGCNCFCTMGAGIAVRMAEEFGCDDFSLEFDDRTGDVNKLGQIDYETFELLDEENDPMKKIYVVNCYTQYHLANKNYPKPLDYTALALCLYKMNRIFKGKHIGLPQIGCGLAGGDWEAVEQIIKLQLKDCDVTVVIYNKQ